jgi:leucyl-tRNA synthetase
MDYPFKEIESKWQLYWEKEESFKTNLQTSKPKFYCLDMFPYPSGAGLHVGHPAGYTATDIISRFKRMKGYEVLHPMGWDAFGLPAEQYAMKTGVHPEITTKSNIQNFKKQIKSLGLSYDWSRELSTTDENYYKWTQWIFLKLYNSYFDNKQNKAIKIENLILSFEKNGSEGYNSKEKFTSAEWKEFSKSKKEQILSEFRLVYKSEIPVNWCEALGSVLANEEIEEWAEKGYTVVRKPMPQYMMRITAYAERLLHDLSFVDWPLSTLEMQKNWIGKSEGLEIDFYTESNHKIAVYTTRPDTLFGATYLVLAPEHSLVKQLLSPSQEQEVNEYIKISSLKSDLDRTELNKEKTGVFLGAYAIHPLTKKQIPIWISDYVLATYGTGAIMAVPAHDSRDFAFAKKFSLPIIQVIQGPSVEEESFDSKESVCISSSSSELDMNGLDYKTAFDKVSDWAEAKKIGKRKIQYKLRDWLFARQRYWGEPIPLVQYENFTEALSESELPLILPKLKEIKPSGTGESPLANANEWLSYSHKEFGKGRRETNTMPQWAGSCWYYLRFIDPQNENELISPELEKKWMSVDLYIGGAEHAVLHLLYSRFWHKVLFDLGYVSTPEPFKKLVHQGLILAEDKRKMSKTFGNVVNPDDVILEYGADSLRLFEMFMGPFEMVKPWSTKGLEGVFRFLNRIWRLFHGKEGDHFFVDDSEPELEEYKILHKTIKKIGEDIENFSFNTAISQMMIFVNEITPRKNRSRKILEPFILLLAPFAPHLAEELWSKMGNSTSLTYEPFPEYNPAYLVEDEVTIVVQVNGKLRAEFQISKTLPEDKILQQAKSLEKIIPFLEGKTIKKEIYVKEKLVNLVVI